jgi:hypothetical protein
MNYIFSQYYNKLLDIEVNDIIPIEMTDELNPFRESFKNLGEVIDSMDVTQIIDENELSQNQEYFAQTFQQRINDPKRINKRAKDSQLYKNNQ